MAYRIIIIILLVAVEALLIYTYRLQRRLDHAEHELDIALRDGRNITIKKHGKCGDTDK